MKLTTRESAILYFSLDPASENQQKSLHPNRRISQSVEGHLIQFSRRVITSSGLPVFTIPLDRQVGDTFGDRISHAIGEIFKQGYSNVIAIGNDCPGLNAKLIARVDQRLVDHNLVVGPATDGGAWIIGINAKIWDQKSFSRLPWKTSSLFQKLILWAPNPHSVFSNLPLLADLDSTKDLEEYLKSFSGPEFLRAAIRNLISTRPVEVNNYFKLYTFSAHLFLKHLRGPPASQFI